MATTPAGFPDIGKIQNAFFKDRIFPYCGAQRPEVIQGPQFGVDVALVDIGNGMMMALTSDPLSLIPTLGLRESAWLSVRLMANDMATTGFGAQYGQFVLNLPPHFHADDFQQYWQYIHEDCKALGIAITGGHTGRFDGLNSTVAGGGTLVTIAPATQVITSRGAQVGDMILMTKSAALIATSILARSFPQYVRAQAGEAVQQAAAASFYDTSAVEAGLAAGAYHRATQAVTAMHDVTEGGVLGAAFEMASAAGLGTDVDVARIPVAAYAQRVCDSFQIDPLLCVGAGAMLMAVRPDHAEALIRHLAHQNIPATTIGTMVEGHGVNLTGHAGLNRLEQAPTDPYWDAFFQAFQQQRT